MTEWLVAWLDGMTTPELALVFCCFFLVIALLQLFILICAKWSMDRGR
jgi:hypothetical protein